MSFAKLGFLSPEVDGYRAEQRERHRAAFDATEALMRRTIDVATAPSSVGSTATPAYLLGVGFWLRSFEACQATILLTERGLQTSAFAMLRTAFECLFYASALWRNPNLFPRLQANHDGERIKQAKGMLREGAAGRVSLEGLEVLRQVAAEAPPNVAHLSAWDAASEAGFLYEYEAAYRGLGLAGAHASPRSLDGFCDAKDDGSVDLGVDPTFDKLPWILSLVRTCLEGGIARQAEAVPIHVG